ncbi:MAG TPA: septum formation family protein, partial [Acidimicrobiales bacterium]|nr:septum formation family protein [Acidimicrobiales bacterium]
AGGGWSPAPPPGGPQQPPPGYDPTFEAAPGAPPPPSGAYRAAAPPPRPGSSGDLPPGFLTGEAKEAKRRRDRRRKRLGLAAGVVVVVAAVVATFAMTAASNKPETVASLEVGDCFNGEASDVEKVECNVAHSAELFAVAPAPDPTIDFPGEDALRTEAGNVCVMELVAYFGGAADVAVANGIELSPVTPTESQWNDGETDTFCLAVSAEGKALGGSIKNEGAG